MNLEINRRRLIQYASAIGGVAVINGLPVVARAATVTRRNVTDSAAQKDLDIYRAAVDAMKNKIPASDKRNWTVQASIHQNHCPHGNWYFLPWHRAYLAAFENIIRDVAQKADFALPYWNWTTGPTIPTPFWTGALNDTTRRVTATTPMPASAVGLTVINSQVLSQTNYQAFGSYMPSGQNSLDNKWQRAGGGTGALEGTPHNTVHGTIGGNMGNYMSPLDPIFWLHHCNVDRLWAVWRSMGRADETNSYWRDFTFPSNFYLPNGTPISPVVKNQLSTEALGYVYDNGRTPNLAAEAVAALAASPTAAVPAGGNPLEGAVLADSASFTAAIGKPETAPVKRASTANLLAAAPPSSANPRYYVILDKVVPPTDPSVGLRLFIDTPGANAETPVEDKGYVGSVAFFGTHDAGHGGPHTVTFVLDVTEKAEALNLKDGRENAITLVPVALNDDKAASKVSVASAKIVAI
ncbi:MAG: tyrosinase family protein [Azospirillaceae bacterium]|nr:tyrosinase family protein [Azospirillaceae bacterium]